MVIDEMVIQIRATAEGVKQGVAVAAQELKKLEEQKAKLQQELKLKVESSDLIRLNKELADAQAKKKEFESAVKFPVDSTSVNQLKKDLQEINEEKAMVEKDLTMHLSAPDFVVATAELERLNEEKKRLEEEIKIQIKADTETTKKQLNDINIEINKIDKDIAIEMESKGINQAATDLKNVDVQLKEVEKSSSEVSKHFPAIAAVATTAFAAIVVAVGKGTDAFNQYTATMNGLASQMEHIGVSMGDALDIVKDKTADGLVNESDIAMSIKNLTTYGFTIDQTSKLLDRLKDSAAYNRQAHYGLGEAIKVTTEGIKNENSTLADAAGVTKNISKMYEEFAKSIGVATTSLTQAQKAQAVYNGIMIETEAAIGNAAKYADTLAGAQAEQEAQALKLAQAYGSAVAPSVQLVTTALTDLLSAATKFVEENQTLVQGVTLGVGAYTAMVAILGAYKTYQAAAVAATELYTAATGKAVIATGTFRGALQSLALNPYVLAITAAVTAIAIIAGEVKKYEQEQEELNTRIEEYNELKKEETTIENVNSKQETIAKISELITSYDDLIEKQKELNNAMLEGNYGTEGEMLDDITQSAVDAAEQYRELAKAASVYGIETDKTLTLEEDTLRIKGLLVEAQEELTGSVEKYNEKVKETATIQISSIDAMKKALEPLQDLDDAYQKLAKGEELSAENMLELIHLYPEVAKHIADNANWRETLIGVIEKEMEKSKAATIAELEGRKQELIAAKVKLVGITALNQKEAESYNAMMADSKAGIKDFTNFVSQAIEAIRTKGMLGAATDAVATAASESVKKEVAAIDAEIATIEASIQTISIVGAVGAETRAAGTTKAATAQKDENTALEEALRLLNEKKNLEDVSAQDELNQLIVIRDLYAKTAQEKIDMNIKIRETQKQANDEWYDEEIAAIEKMNRGREDKTDFQAVINKLNAMLEEAKQRYGEGTKEFVKIEQELTDALAEEAEKRADKLLKITTDNTDARIEAIKRSMDKEALKSGIVDEAGIEFKFTTADKIPYYQQMIDENARVIAELEARGADLTQAEYNEIQKRTDQNKDFYETIDDLSIASIKERQAAEKKATEDNAKKLEQEVKIQEAAQKKITQAVIAGIKDRYSEQIKLAEQQANAEIKVYSDKIAEIDALIKAESRADEQASFADRIKRLQEQLAYEVDPSNIYELQKEISLQQSEEDKRKRRESLDDEKAALQAQINATKEALNEQKTLLAEAQAAEIAIEESRLESFITNLQNKTEEQRKAGVKATENEEKEYTTRAENKVVFDKKLKKLDETSARDKRNLLSRTTDNIITDLYSRITDFADAGKAAGDAWASAYKSAVSSASNAISASSSNNSFAPSAAVGATSYNIDIEQNISAPVATPSQVARETKNMLEDFVRWG